MVYFPRGEGNPFLSSDSEQPSVSELDSKRSAQPFVIGDSRTILLAAGAKIFD